MRALDRPSGPVGGWIGALSLAVLMLTPGCESTSSAVEFQLARGQFATALRLLDEKAAGSDATQLATPDALRARRKFQSAIEREFGRDADDLVARGRPREALEVIRRGLAYCPWSPELARREATLVGPASQIATLDREWRDQDLVEPGQVVLARAIAHDFVDVSSSLRGSPHLRRLLESAREALVGHWITMLGSRHGALPEPQRRELVADLAPIPEVGPLAEPLANLAGIDPFDGESGGLERAIRFTRELIALGQRVPETHPLRPCVEALAASFEATTFEHFDTLMGSEDVSFDEICQGEALTSTMGGPRFLQDALSEAHVRRASRVGRGGTSALLARTHLARAVELGHPKQSAAWSAANAVASAAMEGASWPRLSFTIDVAPDVDPWLQSIVIQAFVQSVLRRCDGWTRLEWVDTRSESPDFRVVIQEARFVLTTSDELTSVSSAYFSHFQEAPNSEKPRLKAELDAAKRRVESTEAAYAAAVAAHNVNPTTYSQTSANNAYTTYSISVDSYNSLVSLYNSTPDTVSEEVFLPYTYLEGTVQFGWEATVQIDTEGSSDIVKATEVDEDFVRIGTKRTDRLESRRSDDPLELDLSAQEALNRLYATLDEVCKGIAPLLEVPDQAITELSDLEQKSLRYLLHPWFDPTADRGAPGIPSWLLGVQKSLEAPDDAKGPEALTVFPPTNPPPVEAAPDELAEWYSPVVCEVRAISGELEIGHGSGVIISGDGLVLTAAHVLVAPRVGITIHSGVLAGDYEAELVFADQRRDVALVRAVGLETQHWAPVRLATPTRPTEEVLAIGNPGLETGVASRGDVTVGRVSNPRVETGHGAYLVADVNISEGSSGGPLVSLEDGAVVGVVQAIAPAGFAGDETGISVSSTGFSCLAAPADLLGAWLGLHQAPE